MADDYILTTKSGGLWVFPDGPNHAAQYIGCTDVGDIAEPLGDIELIRCFDVRGDYKTVGEKVTAPGAITASLTQLTYQTRTWLERVRGKYGFAVLDRTSGRADTFNNWVRAFILQGVRNTNRTYTNLLHHVDDNETTQGFDVTAVPPVIKVVITEGSRVTTTEPYAFNDVAFLEADSGIIPLKYGVAVADGQAAAKGKVWISDDGGASWTDSAAQPFAVNEHIKACAILDMGSGLRRIIVSKEGTGGAVQGQTAYSDDDGATWTVVSIGGAAAGHGCVKGQSIFALDEHHVWLVSAAGFIYFSDNGGSSWTAQESAVITAGDYQAIDMSEDGSFGYAVAEAGIVAKTIDGVAWNACNATITAVPDVLCVHARDEDNVWVGTATGGLWYTEDGGDTWAQRSGWVGSGAGEVHAVWFADDFVGFMLSDTAAPVGRVLQTIDGGYTWKVLTSDANDGLTCMAGGDENYIVYAGLISAGTGFIGVVTE